MNTLSPPEGLLSDCFLSFSFLNMLKFMEPKIYHFICLDLECNKHLLYL